MDLNPFPSFKAYDTVSLYTPLNQRKAHATVLFRLSGLMIRSLYIPSYNYMEQRMFTCLKGPSRLFSYQKRIGFKTGFRHAQSDIVHKSSSKESEKK
jgi:hypothetical protein